MKDGVIVSLVFLMRKLQLEIAGDSVCPKVRSLKAKWMEAFKNRLKCRFKHSLLYFLDSLVLDSNVLNAIQLRSLAFSDCSLCAKLCAEPLG